MAKRDIPAVSGSATYRERRLSPKEVKAGVAALTQQVGAALTQRHLRTRDEARCIFVGQLPNDSRTQVLYPTYAHRWSNNRAVAQGVVNACTKKGYRAYLTEPSYTPEGWTELSFGVVVPANLRVTMS